MAIVYKELGQPCNIKHSIELGWGMNEDASMPPLHDIGPLFLPHPLTARTSGTKLLEEEKKNVKVYMCSHSPAGFTYSCICTKVCERNVSVSITGMCKLRLREVKQPTPGHNVTQLT